MKHKGFITFYKFSVTVKNMVKEKDNVVENDDVIDAEVVELNESIGKEEVNEDEKVDSEIKEDSKGDKSKKERAKKQDKLMKKDKERVAKVFNKGKVSKYEIPKQEDVLRFNLGFNWVEFWVWVGSLSLMLFLAVLVGGASVIGSIFLIILLVKLRTGVTKGYLNKQLWKIGFFYILGLIIAMWVEIVLSGVV